MNREDGSSRPKRRMIHGLRVTNIDDKVHTKSGIQEQTDSCGKAVVHWHQRTNNQEGKGVYRANKSLCDRGRVERVYRNLINDGIAAQVKLLTTDDSDKVDVLVARFENDFGQAQCSPRSGVPSTIVAKYEKILKESTL